MLVWQVGTGKVISKGSWNEEGSESSGWWTVRKDRDGAAREDFYLPIGLVTYSRRTQEELMLKKNSWMKFLFAGAYSENGK